MDYVLHYADEYVLDRVYASVVPARAFLPSTSLLANATASSSSSLFDSIVKHLPHPTLDLNSLASVTASSAWPREYAVRQLLSLYMLTLIGIVLMYFTVATASYYLIFNHDMMRHPRFLKGQVAMEIRSSCIAFPTITALTVPWFFAEVRGRGRYYEDIAEYGWAYALFTIPAFLLFTDTLIYWIHRIEHHPALYKHVHKPHHKWIIPTPFASHAFHPLDGYAQSIPYHMFGALFPFHKKMYLALFSAVNFWSIFVRAPRPRDRVSPTFRD